MGAGRSLTTWGKRGRFTYVGDPRRGTRVLYGRGSSFAITAEQWAALLAHFAGREVEIGLSTRPARDSLGAWLRTRVGVIGAASYVGPILVAEGLAERVHDTLISIHPAVARDEHQ